MMAVFSPDYVRPAARRLLCAIAAAIACCGLLLGASEATAASPPDFSGYWRALGSNALLKTREAQAPPLRPQSLETYRRNIAARAKGDLGFDSLYRCQPPGVPRALTLSPFRILQTGEQLMYLFDWNQVKRRVAVNGSHSTADDPTFMGEAIGTWNEGVLVVSSTHFNDRTLLDDALPHSESLEIVERIRLVQPDVLEDVITITDPETFDSPWTLVLRFGRLPATAPWVEDVCTDRITTLLTVDAK